MIYEYPEFTTVIDRNIFIQYKKGQFRCKNCRQYLNLSLWKCSHNNKCRANYLLRLKTSTTEEIPSKYKESEENMIKNIDEEVDEFFKKKSDSRRRFMLNKINEILFK